MKLLSRILSACIIILCCCDGKENPSENKTPRRLFNEDPTQQVLDSLVKDIHTIYDFPDITVLGSFTCPSTNMGERTYCLPTNSAARARALVAKYLSEYKNCEGNCIIGVQIDETTALNQTCDVSVTIRVGPRKKETSISGMKYTVKWWILCQEEY
jgi:hypothetical protein